jgi:signal transduction histidine kinase
MDAPPRPPESAGPRELTHDVRALREHLSHLREVARSVARISLPVLPAHPAELDRAPLELPTPRAPSWTLLWLRTVTSGTALLLVIFGAYELIERAWIGDAYPAALYYLHIARGMGAAVLIGTWSFYVAMRTRRYYDRVLTANIAGLERLVTERTTELERSQEFTEHLFDSLRDRVIVTDRAGRVVKANRVAREAAPVELSGRVCADVFRECAGNCQAQAVLSGECTSQHGIRRDMDGGRVWAIDTYPVPAATGAPELVLEVGRDVTDEKRLEAQVRHQEKMASLGVLAAGIAHDIGNPLASLSSELEMVETEDDAHAMKESLGVLRTHVDRISRTLREMVDFARRRGEETSDVSVTNAVDDCLRLVRHDQRMRNVTLVTDVPHDLPPVHMVEDHLVMVLVNLVLNALDAMPDGGTLSVRGSFEDDEVVIGIRDDGVGMSRDVLEQVLEPCFTTKAGRGGTGLGMTISDSVIRAVGGRMTLESQPGEGTTVTLRISVGGSANGGGHDDE